MRVVPGSPLSTTMREKLVLETKDVSTFTKLFSRDSLVKTTRAQLQGSNTEMNMFIFGTDADGPDLFKHRNKTRSCDFLLVFPSRDEGTVRIALPF